MRGFAKMTVGSKVDFENPSPGQLYANVDTGQKIILIVSLIEGRSAQVAVQHLGLLPLQEALYDPFGKNFVVTQIGGRTPLELQQCRESRVQQLLVGIVVQQPFNGKV